LVLFILFFFLDYRVAFWTAVGIPISIACTVILLPFFDITINSISLCGLVVVLGMVVDDAIIVAESIYRRMERGAPPAEAAEFGLRVVFKPVVATIATTVIAFTPMFFMGGKLVDKLTGLVPMSIIEDAIMKCLSGYENAYCGRIENE